jgi:hypothetical protein
MTALRPKADIRQRIEHVCFVPKEDIRPRQRHHTAPLNFTAKVSHGDNPKGGPFPYLIAKVH